VTGDDDGGLIRGAGIGAGRRSQASVEKLSLPDDGRGKGRKISGVDDAILVDIRQAKAIGAERDAGVEMVAETDDIDSGGNAIFIDVACELRNCGVRKQKNKEEAMDHGSGSQIQ
jgi:hypothetical protein